MDTCTWKIYTVNGIAGKRGMKRYILLNQGDTNMIDTVINQLHENYCGYMLWNVIFFNVNTYLRLFAFKEYNIPERKVDR